MGRSQETFNKKEVRSKKEKKRKEKEKKRLERKENPKKSSLDDMIAYVDENGNITSTPPEPGKKEEIDIEEIQISVPKGNTMDDYDPIRKGKVTFMNDAKGFGFIKDLETQESVFLHVNNTLEEIKEGDKVTFETEKGPKGLTAIQVKLSK